jgi:hypothetical protein
VRRALLVMVGLAACDSARDRRYANPVSLEQLAEARVAEVDGALVESDQHGFTDRTLDDPLVRSVFVLDEDLQPVAGGSLSRRRDAVAFRDEIVPSLGLRDQPLDTPRHVHQGELRLAFVHHGAEIVLVETDLLSLIADTFPRVFPEDGQVVFQVVDARGELIYGVPGPPKGRSADVPFSEIDGWHVRAWTP